jgi:hypothetical protein
VQLSGKPASEKIVPKPIAAAHRTVFGRGHISTRVELERIRAKFTGNWKLVPSRFMPSKRMTTYLRLAVAERGEDYRRDGFCPIKNLIEFLNEPRQQRDVGSSTKYASVLNEVLVNGKKKARKDLRIKKDYVILNKLRFAF